MFYVAEKLAKQNKELTVKRGFWIGLFQVLAFLPGFSRSGSTISGGLFVGITRKQAAKFSFLMGIPILLGAGVLGLKDVYTENSLTKAMIIGFCVAFVSGLLAIKYLMRYLQNHTLDIFIWYRIVLAIVLIFFLIY